MEVERLRTGTEREYCLSMLIFCDPPNSYYDCVDLNFFPCEFGTYISTSETYINVLIITTITLSQIK